MPLAYSSEKGRLAVPWRPECGKQADLVSVLITRWIIVALPGLKNSTFRRKLLECLRAGQVKDKRGAILLQLSSIQMSVLGC